MKEEDIFGSETYETFISFENCRFQFALARKCRLYRYEKLIGINFSVFFDHVDETAVRSLPFSRIVEDYGAYSPDGTLTGYQDDIFLEVNVKGFNHTDNQYHDLGTYHFSVESKKWATQELRVSSDYISEDSEFTIEFTYALCYTKTEWAGLFKKRMEVWLHEKSDPNPYTLTTEISRTSDGKGGLQGEEEVDTALEDLFARKGIR